MPVVDCPDTAESTEARPALTRVGSGQGSDPSLARCTPSDLIARDTPGPWDGLWDEQSYSSVG